MLTTQQIEDYRRLGYLAVPNVYSANEVAELCRVTDEFVEQSRAATAHTEMFDLEPGHTADAPRLRRLKSPVKAHSVYDAALRHKKTLGIVSQLIGEGLRFNGDKLNMKSAGYGSPVEWHQDWAFYPHTNDDLLAVGIALDEMTLENGALLVVPGSHRGKLYSHHQDGVFVGAITEPDADFSNAAPITVPAGGITIHHVRMVHGSAPNTSGKPRRLLLFQYCAMDAFPIMGVPSWDAFNATVLRGEPTHEARVTEVPVRIPLPMPERAGSIYEIQTQLKTPTLGRKAG